MEPVNNYYAFLSVKLFAITFYSIMYFILGFFTSLGLNYLMPSLRTSSNNSPDETEEVSLFRIIIEIIINFALIGMSFFFIRKIVKNYIPFPLEGFAGFQKDRLKELQGGIIIASIYMSFQTKLLAKLNYFRQRLGI
jgi:hypothetical protein